MNMYPVKSYSFMVHDIFSTCMQLHAEFIETLDNTAKSLMSLFPVSGFLATD